MSYTIIYIGGPRDGLQEKRNSLPNEINIIHPADSKDSRDMNCYVLSKGKTANWYIWEHLKWPI